MRIRTSLIPIVGLGNVFEPTAPASSLRLIRAFIMFPGRSCMMIPSLMLAKEQIPTPALLVDPNALEANLARWRRK